MYKNLKEKVSMLGRRSKKNLWNGRDKNTLCTTNSRLKITTEQIRARKYENIVIEVNQNKTQKEKRPIKNKMNKASMNCVGKIPIA